MPPGSLSRWIYDLRSLGPVCSAGLLEAEGVPLTEEGGGWIQPLPLGWNLGRLSNELQAALREFAWMVTTAKPDGRELEILALSPVA